MQERLDMRIGTAGWSLPALERDAFARREHGLSRYARRFNAVEINSSFYRHHRPSTWLGWAALVPEGFRFAAKLPRAITHDQRLATNAETLGVLDRFLVEFGELGGRRGPLLVQLPPSLEFDATVAGTFLEHLRARWDGGVACEPRHASWFGPGAQELLVSHRVARVAADPARVPAAAEPGGWDQLVYVRLHGSPRMYWSSYGDAYVDELALRLDAAAERGADVWCMFDNTASGAAAGDARRLLERYRASGVAIDRALDRERSGDAARAGPRTPQ